MELRHLRYFIAVAEEEHVTRAARRLFVAQPALSRTIQSLEREIGVPLFERTRQRGMRLTDAGRDFLRHARGLLAQLDCAVQSAQRVARGMGGDLLVGFVEAALHGGVLPEAVRRLRARAPEAEVHLHERTSTQQVEALRVKQLDAALVYAAPGPDDDALHAERLWEEPLVAVLPAAHALAAEAWVPLGEMKGNPLVSFRRAFAPELFDRVLRACGAGGYRPARVVETDRFNNVVGLVAGGLGVGLVPDSMRALAHPGVVYRPVPELGVGMAVHLVMRRDNPLPLADTFAAEVRAAVLARAAAVPLVSAPVPGDG